MSDVLNIIAQARKRQEAAERDRDIWKLRAEHERRRCRSIIGLVKRRPIEPPKIVAEGHPYFDRVQLIVERLAEIFCDPYARYDDEEGSMNHSSVRLLTSYSLSDMIEREVARQNKNETPIENTLENTGDAKPGK